MAIDRFGYWTKEIPPTSIEIVLKAFSEQQGAQLLYDSVTDRFYISFADLSTESEATPDAEDDFRDRWIEVVTDDDGIDVITRLQPPEINAMATSLLQILAEQFELRTEPQA